MNADVWIVHHGNQFHLLHGYLHLAFALATSPEVFVEVGDEGKVRIIHTAEGLMVDQGVHFSPLIH